MTRTALFTRLTLSAAALAFVSGAFAQDSAVAVLKRASAAMGTPKTIRYSGEGTGWTFGQAWQPGTAWPKIEIQSQTRTLNYASGSMRTEIAFNRGEPRGGGGYPIAGQQRDDQYLSGSYAWNVTPAGAAPGARFVVDRTHQLWISPHGVIEAANRNNATVTWQTRGGKSLAAVAFTDQGRFAATAFINDAYQVERVESRVPDAVLGEVSVVTEYSNYRDYGGVQFPGRIQQSAGGFPVLDLTVKEVQPNAPADFALPDSVRTAVERVTTEKVADGVWFVAGGSHNSVAIEMKDHLILVEAPLSDGRSGPVIEEVKKLAPKPIRYVINSHHHFDHAGGLRTAAATGATLLVHAESKAYFDRALATHSKILPDLYTQSKKKASVRGVKNQMTLSDGARTVQIMTIVESDHAAGFMMVYLPKERLLIEADAYTPVPPGAKPPAAPNNANNVNLVVNLDGFKLGIDRILPLHGRVVPVADLYTNAGRAQPK